MQRRPEIDVGGHFQPVVIGDFADQQGVELPLPYVTLTSLDPGVASVSDRGELTGLTQGVGTLRANRGDVQAATAFVVGQPNRFDQIQLFTGLDVYPDAITLVPVVGHKQLQVRVGDADATPLVATDAQYFASNPGIVTVGADGTLTAVGAGDADVTVIYRGVEFVVPVTVRAPVANQAVLGEDGGAIAAADGTVFAIAPDSLEGERLVKVGTVAQSDLPMAVPEDFNFLGAWKLEYDGDSLTTPAQLAIPVPESVPVGKQLYLFRAGGSAERTRRDDPGLVAGRSRRGRRRSRGPHQLATVAWSAPGRRLDAGGSATGRLARARHPHGELPDRRDSDHRRPRHRWHRHGGADDGRQHQREPAEDRGDPAGGPAGGDDGGRQARSGRRDQRAHRADATAPGGAGQPVRSRWPLRVPRDQRKAPCPCSC